MMRNTKVTNTEEKAEDEKLSKAKNKVDINIQKVNRMDPNKQEDKDPEINVRVKTKKGRDTEEASPSSPGHRSETSGSNRAEDQAALGNLNPVVLDDQKEKKKGEIQAVTNGDIEPAKEKDFNNSEDICLAIALEVIESAIKTKTNHKPKDKEEKKDDVQVKVMECATEKESDINDLI